MLITDMENNDEIIKSYVAHSPREPYNTWLVYKPGMVYPYDTLRITEENDDLTDETYTHMNDYKVADVLTTINTLIYWVYSNMVK